MNESRYYKYSAFLHFAQVDHGYLDWYHCILGFFEIHD